MADGIFATLGEAQTSISGRSKHYCEATGYITGNILKTDNTDILSAFKEKHLDLIETIF